MGKRKSDGGAAEGRGDAEPVSVNGFTVLRVRMARLPFVRVLYIKAHRSKKDDGSALPGDRTVFVANAGLGEDALRAALSGFGEIERVELSGRGRQHGAQHSYVQAPAHQAAAPAGAPSEGPQHAHVVFSKKRACEAALACSMVIEPPAVDDDTDAEQHPGESQGVRAWVQEHRDREVAEGELQASVDAYMTYFDERTEEEKRARRDRVVDDDGFELVTYKRKSHAPETPEPPKKKKELVDFYRFQIREKKREELAALRNKFEADKRRVEAMCVPFCALFESCDPASPHVSSPFWYCPLLFLT